MDESLDTRPGLKKRKFEGFCSVKNLRDALGVHPAALPPHYRLPKPDKDLHAAWKKHKLCTHKGIYLVIWEWKDRRWKDRPEFLNPGTGGYFQRKDPNVSIDKLKNDWVEDALIIYVGRSGNLQERIELLIRFGCGENNIGHHGGRLMWQIKDAEDLKVCWKVMADDKQENEKEQLLAEFKQAHGKWPFANYPNRKN